MNISLPFFHMAVNHFMPRTMEEANILLGVYQGKIDTSRWDHHSQEHIQRDLEYIPRILEYYNHISEIDNTYAMQRAGDDLKNFSLGRMKSKPKKRPGIRRRLSQRPRSPLRNLSHAQLDGAMNNLRIRSRSPSPIRSRSSLDAAMNNLRIRSGKILRSPSPIRSRSPSQKKTRR